MTKKNKKKSKLMEMFKEGKVAVILGVVWGVLLILYPQPIFIYSFPLTIVSTIIYLVFYSNSYPSESIFYLSVLISILMIPLVCSAITLTIYTIGTKYKNG